MKHKILAGLFAVPLLVLALVQTSRADDAITTTTCKDGTTSASTGRGTCSGHGGVQKAAAPVAAPAAPAASAAPAPSASATPAASAAPAAPSSTTPPPPAAKTVAGSPAGATAKCKDGTYSKSQHRSGTCSSHGGVDTWLTAQ